MPKVSRALLVLLVLSVPFAFLNYIGISYHLYWFYWWYDVVMHFYGGVIVGLGSYWALFESGRVLARRSSRPIHVVLWILLFGLLFGIGWEVMEYVSGLTESHEGYILDTMNDLILDSSGAVFVALIVSEKRKHSSVTSL